MGTEQPDHELMMAYVKGDELAFGVLFEKYSPKLNSFLRYRLAAKKKHLIEEVYQKTWLKIHAGRMSFDPSKKFSTWFYTVALNTLRDEVGSLFERSQHEEINDQSTLHSPNSEDQYITKELFKQVEALFKFLTENQKTALLLSDQEEMSSKDIADVMGISDASVRQLISRARKIIRSRYSEMEKS